MLPCDAALHHDRAAPVANPTAVQEVLSGKRKEANAVWWGFDEKDVTKALQGALRSRAKKLTVPNVGKPWVVGPLFPRYFFCRLNLSKSFRAVRYSPQVIDVVSFGGRPTVVDDDHYGSGADRARLGHPGLEER